MAISRLTRQAGLTLLEVLVSLGILATVTTGIVALSNQQSEKTKASVVALHTKMVGTAAAEYIKENYSTILSTATTTKPVLIRVSDMISSGKLQAGFNPKNARGQDTCVLVLKQSATNLTSLLVTEGGEVIDDLSLGQIASEIGAAGGGIYSTAAGNIRGSMGGWNTAIGAFANPNHLGQKCSGAAGNIALTAGHPVMALWFADSQDVSATLYRDSVPGNPSLNTMGTAIKMGGNNIDNAGSVNATNVAATGNITAGNRVTSGEYLQIKGTVVEGTACSSDDLVARDATGLILSCQSGSWKKAVKSPNSYRYVFTSSQNWTVPAGVSSAFVTMAGGGGSGAGWRVRNATITGHSGGYVFSHPVNLIAGETIQIIVGKGGNSFSPINTGIPAQPGPPYYIFAAPAGDDGLGGYPGTSSMIISPSMGKLLECSGGSGVSFGGIDSYSGDKVAGNLDGATVGSGSPVFPSPNRVASGSYVTPDGPGACGPGQYGAGNFGSISFLVYAGRFAGGKTPFGYGSGGDVSVIGCHVTATYSGMCIAPEPSKDGVVFLDVLY